MTARGGGAGRAIGVFDSGVGGLTVFKALRRALPSDRLLYFGDTARVPYGSKTREAVTRFSFEIARFLERQRIKLLVVACNSASALALPALKAALRVPVVGVIDPAVRAAAAASRTGTIGVIGTEATVASGAYQRALRALARGPRIVAAACPLLVPLVEEGWWRHPVTRSVAGEYLRPLLRTRMDVLILGCTHYPLIRGLLQRVAGRKVRLMDSGEETALEVKGLLAANGLLRRSGCGSEAFFVTDGPDRFHRLARRFLGGPSPRVRVVRLAS
ncbi:MAG: glutamate racemase [Elusimicrobiota bacterium]